MTIEPKFNVESFLAALDAQRHAKRITWKKLSEEAGVPASTLTRMSQGRKPDIDTLTALCRWSGLSADKFMQGAGLEPVEPIAEISALFRADTNLSRENAIALEAILKTAYEQLRKK